MRKKIRFFWIWTFAFCLLAFTKDSRATFRPIYQAMLSQLDKEYVEFSKKYFFKYERIFQSFPKDREMYLLSELRKIHQEHTLGSINITKNFIKKRIELFNKLEKHQTAASNLNREICSYKKNNSFDNLQTEEDASSIQEETVQTSKALKKEIGHFFQSLKEYKQNLKKLDDLDRGTQLVKPSVRKILNLKEELNAYNREKNKEIEFEIKNYNLVIYELNGYLFYKKWLFHQMKRKIYEKTKMNRIYSQHEIKLGDFFSEFFIKYLNICLQLNIMHQSVFDFLIFNEFEKHAKNYELAYEEFLRTWFESGNSNEWIIREFNQLIKNYLEKKKLIEIHKNKIFTLKVQIELNSRLKGLTAVQILNQFRNDYVEQREQLLKKKEQSDLILGKYCSDGYQNLVKFFNLWLTGNKSIKLAEFVIEQLRDMTLGPKGVQIVELMNKFLFKNKIIDVTQNLSQQEKLIAKIKEEILKLDADFIQDCSQKYQIFQAQKHKILSYFDPHLSELFWLYQKKIKLVEDEKQVLSQILLNMVLVEDKDQENLKSRVRNYQRSVEELETQVKEFKTTEKREYIEFSSFFNFVRNFKRDPIQRELKLESYQGQKVVEHLIVSVSDKRALASSWYRSLAQNQAVFDWRNVSHVSEAFGSSLSESEFDEFKEALFVKSMESMSCHFYLAKLENGQSAYLVELLGEFYWITSTGELEVVSSEFSVDTLFRVDSYQVKEEVGWE